MEKLTLKKLVDICDALSNPLRVKLLAILADKEWYIYELAKKLNVSRQILYLHLKKLEKAGLVESNYKLEEGDPRVKRFYRAKFFELYINLYVIKDLFRNGEKFDEKYIEKEREEE